MTLARGRHRVVGPGLGVINPPMGPLSLRSGRKARVSEARLVEEPGPRFRNRVVGARAPAPAGLDSSGVVGVLTGFGLAAADHRDRGHRAPEDLLQPGTRYRRAALAAQPRTVLQRIFPLGLRRSGLTLLGLGLLRSRLLNALAQLDPRRVASRATVDGGALHDLVRLLSAARVLARPGDEESGAHGR